MTPVVLNAHEIAGCIKRVAPETAIVVGGPHASALPQQTLEEFPSFDYAAFGEGEVTMLELCEALRDGRDVSSMPGLACRAGDSVTMGPPRALIEDLDADAIASVLTGREWRIVLHNKGKALASWRSRGVSARPDHEERALRVHYRDGVDLLMSLRI